jgi:GTP-binding protein LepA
MDIERERGITIKSNSITLHYTAKDGQDYELNLIDTPGHVDFSHEVRRSLMSCEGALLLVDASQGVEAQTVANLYLALEYDLELLPVINKIDLPSADIERVQEEIDADLGLDPYEAIHVSAKTGKGVDELLEAIVHKLPSPIGDPDAKTQALIFDAQYDIYRGVVLLCRVKNGELRLGQKIRLMHTDREFEIEELGHLLLERRPEKCLPTGSVGYVIAGVKNISEINVGDTITDAEDPADEPIPGYREAKPVVFSSIYPVSSDEYGDLTKALDKLKLNDAALTFEKDSSTALGFGFRCGFLGLLHLDVVQERLEREHDLSLVLSAPSVQYQVRMANGETVTIDNPSHFPEATKVDFVEEPFIKGSVMVPERYLGAVMELCIERRGENTLFQYLSAGRIELTSEMPLAEVLYDFYDRLKTVTQGYGSFDYEIIDYRRTDLVKVDILVNGDKVDALSQLVHRDKARARALKYCERLADTIPKQQFKIAIQGAIGGQVIARSTISAFRKDVTAKCYGGDISRKRKLLEKQREGKKRMKMVGSIEIPQEAFVSVLRSDK